MPPHPSSIYTEQLPTVGEGDAIWLPEPHVSGEVQIGDVGYILEGAFVRLFNVISPEDHPVPDSDLPDGFEPLQEPRMRCMDTRERALAPGHHNSKSVVCSKIQLNVEGYAYATMIYSRILTGKQIPCSWCQCRDCLGVYLPQRKGCSAHLGELCHQENRTSSTPFRKVCG